MDAPRILIMVVAEGHPEGTVAMEDEVEASPPAHDAGGAAGREVGVVHAVAHATADHGPGPTPGHDRAPSRARPAGASLNPRPGPGPNRSPSPNPAPGAAHHLPIEHQSPDQDRRASPSHQRRKALRPN
uniref:Uncharacterized protein n=1 Tax=Anguilla anguilla TaxID=7936 RepID=A0A0E9XE73_ANGAN